MRKKPLTYLSLMEDALDKEAMVELFNQRRLAVDEENSNWAEDFSSSNRSGSGSRMSRSEDSANSNSADTGSGNSRNVENQIESQCGVLQQLQNELEKLGFV
ncbi:hypothetical protein R1flu_018275 [Riccia fluitans]|uniref:Uncharacterized protein n=1 Tax=Riccia fluitans TaxID=41844 RepID=A0ABD1ZFC7_9MARC